MRQEVTNFSNDDAGIIEETPGEVSISSRVNNQFTDARNHDVISYLQRPQIIDDFDYKGERNTILSKTTVPDTMLTTMYRAKLDGFTSFRATAVYRLQINAMPFQCGRLLMYAVPMPTLTTPREDWLSGCVTNAQSLHCVQIDIAQQTEVELRVPFVSPFNSYDLINGRYPWARVYVMVYSPLNQVEINELECLLWAHFEDIELGAPTSGAIAQQQSGKVKKGAPKEMSPAAVKEIRVAESSGLNIGAISSGATTGWNKIGETLPAFKPVTDIFGGLASAAGSFLKPITGLLGGLLGFSKPVLNHSGNTVVARPAQYFGNVDGNDHSHVLSLAAMNAIDEYPGLGGTDLSETSLDFLKTIPQYVGQFCFGKGNNYGDLLWEAYIKPGALAPVDVVVTPMNPNPDLYEVPPPQTTRIPTILNYISSVFTYWTGSLVYTFRFVKTQFHSGRVEISFHPFVENVDSKRMDYVYRLVVDLRDNSEVSVAIPYISPTPWKIFDYRQGIYDQTDYNSYSTGKIVVRALTKLVTSSTIAPNNIECLVELRAGEDYRLQAPVKSPWYPIRFPTQLTALKQQSAAVQQSGNVYAFPGTFETRKTAIEGKMPSSISGQQGDVERESPEMFCAGEIFSDYTALTRRFAFVDHVTLPNKQCLFRDVVEYVRPPELATFSGQYDSQNKGKFFFKFVYQPSPLNFVSSMYAFFRGSLRVKVYTPQETDLIGCQLGFKQDTGYALQGNPRSNFITPVHFEQPGTKKFAEFQIPYYSPTLVTVSYPEETLGKLFTQPQVNLAIGFSDLESDERDAYVAVAAGDDMTFHMFLGTPPSLDINIFKLTWKPEAPTGAEVIPIVDITNNFNPCFYPDSIANPLAQTKQEAPILGISGVKFMDLYTPCKHVSVASS